VPKVLLRAKRKNLVGISIVLFKFFAVKDTIENDFVICGFEVGFDDRFVVDIPFCFLRFEMHLTDKRDVIDADAERDPVDFRRIGHFFRYCG
jgi:hypothetical protein